MVRKRDGLVPIGEVIADLPEPVPGAPRSTPDRRNTTSPKPIRCTSLFRPAKRTPTGASWRG